MVRTLMLLILIVATPMLRAETVLGHGTEQESAGYAEPSLTEHPGESLPGWIPVIDEEGKEIALQTLLDRPAVLTLVYYRCRDVCPEMLIALARVLAKLKSVPGKDYRIITLSIDDTDSPEDARARKRDLFASGELTPPGDSWRFLTASPETIRRICEAVGVFYKRTETGFIHPQVLIFLSAGGMIIRYVHLSRFSYGAALPISFSPVEISDSLASASLNRIGAPNARSPLYCSVDREGLKGYFGILQACGIATLLMLLALMLYFGWSGKRKRKKGG